MALSPHDHERCIEDLEDALAEARRKLRVAGRPGAAALLENLEGARLASYRT